ncbi:MAG: hypothetical protein DLM53_00940 [Candidatus Eremiobacter antarcticus]|nr:divergent polysaccharide deacetylase family protein [Candidatus Eremiobacteraeota bacterium]MBC5809094.1 divergent polysaccharide deacetylase family protein [Candidatus Eremiobacteraeota bacterium]PZR64321.1 MAG: hypothetical protein DLM53_00940 [Candidatus Eremiobacter sp. RRmetagenome_bin22]
MPGRSRRRASRKQIRTPGGAFPLVAAGAFIALIVFGIVAVNRQMQGYLTATRHHKRVATAARTPAPSVLETPPQPAAVPTGTPSPAGSAAPESSASPIKSAPRLAVIIDDCGYNLERDRRFLALPIPITLSILPKTPHGQEIAEEAVAAGKSVMLHLPMEPESTQAHPGPGVITTAMDDDQVKAQVESDIESLPGMPGANNHMGSKATSDPRVMRDVLGVFRQHRLFFIDSMTSQTTVGESLARDMGVPTAARDVFLDNFTDLPYVERQLTAAGDVALKKGTAIAIGHPNESTAAALASLIPKIQAAGIVFVPAQTLVN